jgi:hypothetical protein
MTQICLRKQHNGLDKEGKGTQMVNRPIAEMAMYFGDKNNTGQYDNGVWLDLLQIPFLQDINEAGFFRTIIRTLWIESSGWSKTIKNKWPQLTLIGLSDHPLGSHISRLPADKQYAYLSDLEYLDGLMAHTYEQEQFYKTVIPSKPVVRVGLPFPVENYEKNYGSLRESPREYIGLGVGAADNDRNFISNLLVFQTLRLKNPNLQGVFLSVPHQLMPYCTYMADKFEGVYVHKRTSMNEYLDVLSRCKMVISLPDRNTPGRLQGEAAFLKIPVVGSDMLELQNELYPDLSVEPFSLQDAIERAEHVLEDPEWSEKISQDAYDILLREYNYEKSRERFDSLLAQIKG